MRAVHCPEPGSRTARIMPRERGKELASEPREQYRELPLAPQPQAVAFQGAVQLTRSDPANRTKRLNIPD